MQRSDTGKVIRRSAFAALAVIASALALEGCATAPQGSTQLSWPVGVTYTVQDGDTVSEIAEAYRLPEATLVSYNGLHDPDEIYVGQVLRIPRDGYVPAARPSPRPSYRVARARPAPRRHEVREARDSRPVRAPDPRPEPRPQRVEQAQAVATGGPVHFVWPVSGRVIAPFGATASGGRNDGINIAASLGAPIHAAASGTVIYAGNELKGYGNLVLIRHEDGYVTAYAHAERLAVERGAHVRKGAVIGYAGATGDVTSPQLHFEIRRGVQPIDPKPLLMASAAS